MTRLHRHPCAVVCCGLAAGVLALAGDTARAQSVSAIGTATGAPAQPARSWIQPFVEMDEDPFTQLSLPGSSLNFKPANITSVPYQKTQPLFTTPAYVGALPSSPAASPAAPASQAGTQAAAGPAVRVDPLPTNLPPADLTPTEWKSPPRSYITATSGASTPALPPPPKSFWRGWSGSIEGGLNGSSGNSENFSIRGGINAARASETATTTASLAYTYDTSDGVNTKSRGVFDLRNDWNISERWVLFAIAKTEYDEFQDWDWRLSLFVGPGYYFIKEEQTQLLGRIGVGVTKELGGSRDDFTPEGLLGFDLLHTLTERQKLFLTADFLPDLSELGEYRINAKAGWEILVDPEVNLTLKLGVEDRFNTNPGPNRRGNDLEYFALLVWPF